MPKTLKEVTENLELSQFRDSEKLYKIAFESLSAMFYVQRMKPHYKILYISRLLNQSVIRQRNGIKNPKMFQKITHPDDLERILKQNRRIKKKCRNVKAIMNIGF